MVRIETSPSVAWKASSDNADNTRLERIFVFFTQLQINLTEGTPFNIAVHEEVASYYGIPSVSFASEVYKLITLGEVQWVDLAPDRVHPNDAGHGLYAKILQAYLEGALVENADADMDKECTNRQEVVSLPPPVDPNNYEYAVMMEVDAADCFDRFEWRNLTSEPLMNWRYETRHLYTNMCDASLSFTAYGQSAGFYCYAGRTRGYLSMR
jgi:acyl-CoA thioesterase-1